MKIFYSENHRRHYPPYEIFDGGKRVPYLENPDRMDKILSALRKTNCADFSEPDDFGLDPILAVHDSDYIRFLASAWDEWRASDPEVDAASESFALLPATFALRRQPHKQTSLLGKAGYYIMDLSACIAEATYQAALSSANCALSGAKFISENSSFRRSGIMPLSPTSAIRDAEAAFALCRPPGHHAGKDYAAGYCFINNTAVAANYLSAKGKVAVLDIDYHAGNGTQDIFYERADVLTISIHGDPEDEYPHFIGFADETGSGAGLGFHKNFPLPAGTDDEKYLSTLNEAIKRIQNFSPKYLVVSAGMDIYDGDPLGRFKVTREGIREIGKRIAALNLQSLVVMEGGYANDALGENVVALLGSFK